MAARLPIRGPMGIGELLDGAFRLYRAHFGKFVLAAAIFFIPVGIMATLATGVTMSSYTDFFLATLDQPASSPELESLIVRQTGMTLITTLLVALTGYVVGMIAFLTLTVQAQALINQTELTIGQSIRNGLRRFWPFAGLTFLIGLAAIGLLIVFYIVLVLSAFALAALLFGLTSIESGGNDVAAIGIVIMAFFIYVAIFFVALLPLIYVSARWMLAPVLIVVESCGPIQALGRSWQLTQQSFWRLAGYIFLLALLNSIVLGLPLLLLQALALIVMASEFFGWINGLISGVGYLISVLWYPFFALVLVLIYYDLRVRRESLDLRLRVQALESSLRPTFLPRNE